MNKIPSVKKRLLLYFCVLLFVSLLCFIVYGYYSISTYEHQQLYCNQAAIDIFSNQVSSELDDLVSFNQDIYSNDNDFQMLSIISISEQQRLISEHNLRRIIKNRVPACGAIFIFNTSGTEYFYRFGSELQDFPLVNSHIRLMRNLRAFWLSADDTALMKWQVYTDESNTLLINAYRLRDLYVCSVLDLNSFSNTCKDSTSALQYAFFSPNQVLTNRTYVTQTGLPLDFIKAPAHDLPTVLSYGHLVQSVYFDAYGVGMCGIMPLQGIWAYSRFSIFLLLTVLAALCVAFYIIYRLMQRILIYPLNQISLASQQLTRSIPNARPTTTEKELKEFRTIRIALEQLVLQKVGLQTENTTKEREKEHALLQYYQLQTRSHFFLNCLKSLYNMLENGEQEKMRVMILAFSNHLRYIFHDNLSLVSLRSELDEVTDYHHIIQLDRLRPSLLSQQVDPALLDCMVPPLVIQTFLENSYKHNGKAEDLLRFSIQADRVELEQKPYLRIRLCDNGVGYSGDMLKQLNAEDSDCLEPDHVGIGNLKRRIALIYQNDYQAAFFNLPSGGACSLICLPFRTV